MEENRDLNRLKVVLADKKRTNKWLAEQLGKDPATISKWCTNTCQPDLGNLIKISQYLEVDVNELLRFSTWGLFFQSREKGMPLLSKNR